VPCFDPFLAVIWCLGRSGTTGLVPLQRWRLRRSLPLLRCCLMSHYFKRSFCFCFKCVEQLWFKVATNTLRSLQGCSYQYAVLSLARTLLEGCVAPCPYQQNSLFMLLLTITRQYPTSWFSGCPTCACVSLPIYAGSVGLVALSVFNACADAAVWAPGKADKRLQIHGTNYS